MQLYREHADKLADLLGLEETRIGDNVTAFVGEALINMATRIRALEEAAKDPQIAKTQFHPVWVNWNEPGMSNFDDILSGMTREERMEHLCGSWDSGETPDEQL